MTWTEITPTDRVTGPEISVVDPGWTTALAPSLSEEIHPEVIAVSGWVEID